MQIKYCEHCKDETHHDEDGCLRCAKTNKVIVHIPMNILDMMIKTYNMTTDEAIDNTVNTVRAEIKMNYELWLKENE